MLAKLRAGWFGRWRSADPADLPPLEPRPLWLELDRLARSRRPAAAAHARNRVGGALRTLLPGTADAHTDAEEALLRGFVDVLGDEARTAATANAAPCTRIDTPTARLLARFLTSEKLQLWRDVPDLTCEIFLPARTATPTCGALATIWLVWLGDHGVARRRRGGRPGERSWRGGSPARERSSPRSAAAAADAAVGPHPPRPRPAAPCAWNQPGDQDQVALAHWRC
ncbi:hypothetical protein ACU686_18675 [Yinghuangia aomiensis]